MAGCAVPKCSSRSRTTRFPKDPKRRKLWVMKMKRDKFVVKDTSRICVSHFEDSMFFTTKNGRRFLKKDSYPTIFSFNKSSTPRKPPKQRNIEIPSQKPDDKQIKMEHSYSTVPILFEDIKIEVPEVMGYCNESQNSEVQEIVEIFEQNHFSGDNNAVDINNTQVSFKQEVIENDEDESQSGDKEIEDLKCEQESGVPDNNFQEQIKILQKANESLSNKNLFLIRQNNLLIRKNTRLMRKNKNLSAKIYRKEKKVESPLPKFLNDDQIECLTRGSLAGKKWSSSTIQKALHLKLSCGTSGYETLLEQKYPLPSLRSLRCHNEKDKLCAHTFDKISIQKALQDDGKSDGLNKELK